MISSFSSSITTSTDNDTFYGWACPGKGQPLEWCKLPLKTLENDDVEIAITHCGICATDLHVMNSDWGPTDYPFVGGHEIVGTITKIGKDITQLKIGDQVGIGAHCDSCHECKECKNDQENVCRQGAKRTITGYWANGDKIYGGFGTKWRGKGHFVFKIPMDLIHQYGGGASCTSFFCAGIATYAPLKKHGVTKGSVVGVIGIGGLGHFAIQWAKALGAKVIVFSTSDLKRKDAKALGADEFILTTSNTTSTDSSSSSPHKLSLSHIIMCTRFGINEFNWSYYLSFMEPNSVFIMTTAPGPFLQGIPVSVILQRQITIVGAAVGSPKEIQEMLYFANRHRQDIKPWIEKVYSMNQIENAIQVVKNGGARYRVVLQVE